MLLIYVPKLTNRLGYTLNLVFKVILETDYQITINKTEFTDYKGAKLVYGNECIPDSFFIQSVDLLFQTTIEIVELKPFTRADSVAFFPTYNTQSHYSFDVFAAIFYLVSRYEEYLPHEIDEHGRYKPENSIAYQLGFLQKPLVNQWIIELSHAIKEIFPDFALSKSRFNTILTIDIDNAFAFKNKGFLRTIGGYFSSLLKADYKGVISRTKVLLGIDSDPYDTYAFIIENIKKYHLKAIFFVLYAEYGSRDKNISNNNSHYQVLLKSLGDYAKIGIHPSYASFNNPKYLKREILKLSSVMRKPIARSRFHYIRFRLPESYRELLENGILNDYSMGYSTEIGFRASICSPYPFYDLENNCETNLQVHPFFIMESTLRYCKMYSSSEAFLYYKEMIDAIKEVNGAFYCIWHNESLSNSEGWEGWDKTFVQVIEYALQNSDF